MALPIRYAVVSPPHRWRQAVMLASQPTDELANDGYDT